MAQVLPPAKDPLEGRTVGGKFELLKLIRTDDLGRIYRARHLMLERAVSVRLLHGSHLDDEALTERFRRGGLAAARIRHANVVDVIDFGQEPDGSLYMVFELVQGRNLRELTTAEGNLPPNRVVDLTMQISAGMYAAHENGVVHRDVKPENVVVLTEEDDDGNIVDRIKILNFGVAKIEEPLNMPGRKTIEMVTGDPAFMSPEQCNGLGLDSRSDIYGIGCLAYFMATGHPPFEGSTLDLLVKHVQETPRPPSRGSPDLPAAFDAVIAKALAKKPEDRYGSARALRDALKALDVAPPTPSSQITIDIDEQGEATKPVVMPHALDAQVTPIRQRPDVPTEEDHDDQITNPALAVGPDLSEELDPTPSPGPAREPRPPPGPHVERFRDTLMMTRDEHGFGRRRKSTTLLVIAVFAAIVVGILGGLLAGHAFAPEAPEQHAE